MRPVALGPDDAEAAVALWRAAGLTRPWNDPFDDFARAATGATSCVLGVRDGDALTGTAMVGEDGHRGWLYYLAVAEAWQGRGVGRTLVRAAEDWLAARGVPHLRLMVRGDNSAVMGFYAALGYSASDVTVLGRALGAGEPR